MLISFRFSQWCSVFYIWVAYTSFPVWAAEDSDVQVPVMMDGVDPKKDDTYLHTAMKLPDDKTYFITKFEPKASMAVVHHIIARGCNYAVNITTTLAICVGPDKIMYAWARGAPTLQLPDDVGYKVGKDTDVKYILLQVHYGNASAVPATGDRSGIIFHLTPKKLNKEAGILLMSTGGSMDANSTVSYEVACQITDDVTFHPFAFRTHTHRHGVLVRGYKIGPKHTDENNIQLIGEKNPLLPQFFYPVENKNLTVTTGDILAASCLMRNDENRTVYVGSTSNDEMCNFYIMYYVEGSRHPTGGCGSAGPPHYSWATDPLLKSIYMPK